MKTRANKAERPDKRIPPRAGAARQSVTGNLSRAAPGIELQDASSTSANEPTLQHSIDTSPRQLAQAKQLSAVFGGPEQQAEGEKQQRTPTAPIAAQYDTGEEDTPSHGRFDGAQRRGTDEYGPLQGKLDSGQAPVQSKTGKGDDETPTGVPDRLKAGIQRLSGVDLSDVRVQPNSPAPAQLNAHAYAQGNEIHLGPGQEKHLPHEAWHLVQQRQGRVQPTAQLAGVQLNDEEGLEREADLMGGRADRGERGDKKPVPASIPVQRVSNETNTDITSTQGTGREALTDNPEMHVSAVRRSFASRVTRTLGLEEGYVDNPSGADAGLSPEGEAQARKENALSVIAASTSQLRGKTKTVAKERPGVPEQKAEAVTEPRESIAPGAEPKAVAGEVAAARVPVEGVAMPADELRGPGPKSGAAVNRLRSTQGVDPAFVQLATIIDTRISNLRGRAGANANRAAARLQSNAAARRGEIQGAMGASQAAVRSTMEAARTRIGDTRSTSHDALSAAGEDAHGRNSEFTDTETTRLQDNLDGSVEEARTIFSDADVAIRAAGDREAARGRDHAYDLARRARDMGRSEASRYRRVEEDEDLGEDKAEAVMDVANRFARQLERDGANINSDVHAQADEAREQVSAEEEPTVAGLEDVAPGAVESIGTFLGSIDEAMDNVVQQGCDQLDAAETASIAEIDNLDRASEGRGEALLAEGEAGLDAALTAGLLAQANLAGQAGQLLDEAAGNSIDQMTQAATAGASSPATAGPAIQRQEEEAGEPVEGALPQGTHDQVLGQLEQVGPSLDQAADTQTADLSQSLNTASTGAVDAGNAWVSETQGRMDGLLDTANTGFGEITEGACSQLDSVLEQGQSQAGSEVDRISDDVDSNVGQLRQSVTDSVGEATDNLQGGTEEGITHADEVFDELPSQMDRAAEAQESFFGSIGHWFSEQLAETWEAIKGMADWGFILDLVVGIVVGVLVAVAVAALIGTGVGALLLAGALAGAAGFAAAQMSANVRNGDPLLQGVGRAAILGAFVGFGVALAGPGVLGLGMLAGTGVVMLAAGVGTVVANLATGHEWDDHLLATVLIVGVFHAAMKPVMERIPIRLRPKRGSPAEEPEPVRPPGEEAEPVRPPGKEPPEPVRPTGEEPEPVRRPVEEQRRSPERVTDWREGDPLPRAQDAVIDSAKFERYSMDPTNPGNNGKWQAFEEVGYDVHDAAGRASGAQDVISQLRGQLPRTEATRGQVTEHGQRFQVRTRIRGPNGREGTLVTVWQFDRGSSTPRLITNWLEVHRGAPPTGSRSMPGRGATEEGGTSTEGSSRRSAAESRTVDEAEPQQPSRPAETTEGGRVKGYYDDGTVAYDGSVDPRIGNPRPGEWARGREQVRTDRGNNRVYQRRVFTETPDGQRVVIDIDYTNHGRGDHVAPHHHVYVENIRGNPRSGWRKLKTPTSRGRPGEPSLDADGRYTGEPE